MRGCECPLGEGTGHKKNAGASNHILDLDLNILPSTPNPKRVEEHSPASQPWHEVDNQLELLESLIDDDLLDHVNRHQAACKAFEMGQLSLHELRSKCTETSTKWNQLKLSNLGDQPEGRARLFCLQESLLAWHALEKLWERRGTHQLADPANVEVRLDTAYNTA